MSGLDKDKRAKVYSDFQVDRKYETSGKNWQFRVKLNNDRVDALRVTSPIPIPLAQRRTTDTCCLLRAVVPLAQTTLVAWDCYRHATCKAQPDANTCTVNESTRLVATIFSASIDLLYLPSTCRFDCNEHKRGYVCKSASTLPCVSLPSHTQPCLSLIVTAPNDELRPVLTFYFDLGMNDKDIAHSVMDHFDPACYGLRCVLALFSPCTDILITLFV